MRRFAQESYNAWNDVDAQGFSSSMESESIVSRVTDAWMTDPVPWSCECPKTSWK